MLSRHRSSSTWKKATEISGGEAKIAYAAHQASVDEAAALFVFAPEGRENSGDRGSTRPWVCQECASRFNDFRCCCVFLDSGAHSGAQRLIKVDLRGAIINRTPHCGSDAILAAFREMCDSIAV